MSRENVELVEGLYAGVAGADKQTLLAALPQLIEQACDPEIEWVEHADRADASTHVGHAGVRESWERWLEGFGEYSFEVEEVLDAGDNVLVVGSEQAQGAASGAPVSSRTYAVLTLRAGKILRYQEFLDEPSARRATGLTDERAHRASPGTSP
jgi:ketosteroid isomerase-like protein